MDAGGQARPADRRAPCCTTTARRGTWPRRWPRGCARTSPRSAGRLPGRERGAAAGRAVAAGRAGRPGADRERAAHAPLGRGRPGPGHPALHRGRRRGAGGGALLRARRADRAAARGRRERDLARPVAVARPAVSTRWASCVDAGVVLFAGAVAATGTDAADLGRGGGDGVRGCGTGSASTPRCCRRRSWSRRPVAWPGRRRPTPGRRWRSASRRPADSPKIDLTCHRAAGRTVVPVG